MYYMPWFLKVLHNIWYALKMFLMKDWTIPWNLYLCLKDYEFIENKQKQIITNNFKQAQITNLIYVILQIQLLLG